MNPLPPMGDDWREGTTQRIAYPEVPAMTTNPLRLLKTFSQSVWLDFLSREKMASGQLQRMIVAGINVNWPFPPEYWSCYTDPAGKTRCPSSNYTGIIGVSIIN